jgi:hypothetical protein
LGGKKSGRKAGSATADGDDVIDLIPFGSIGRVKSNWRG